MQDIKKVCVYCASSNKIDTKYFKATEILARALVKNNTSVVYGGGATGLMGCLADTVLANDGHVIGIMPQFMKEVEYHHKGVNDFVFTADMHERKKKLMVGVDALIALPGGCGTFEELMEAITLKRLGIFTKPILILNLDGYYDKLLDMMQHSVDCGFMAKRHLEMWTVFDKPEEVLKAIKNSAPWSDDALSFAVV